jgi:hypothetical protein
MSDDAGQQAQPIDVFEALATSLDLFAALAWQKMGLQPDMATGRLAPDMKQAKAAVDTAVALAAVLEPALEDDADKRRVQNLVRDLRLNYVEKSGA